MKGLVETQASTSKILPPKTSSEIEATSPKCSHIIPLPISPPTSGYISLPPQLPVVVIPELAVPAHTLPEWINHPEARKDYKCQLCAFQHTDRDCMLMHIWQHLKISIRCPMCRKGFQNAASLCKHRKGSTQSTSSRWKMNEGIYMSLGFPLSYWEAGLYLC